VPDQICEPLLFVIPARGGSKGVPRKNLAKVGGIPLVARAVWTAMKALETTPYQGRVICSTDDEAIAEAARRWGAEVPFIRPACLATDEASSLDVVLHAIRECGATKGTVVVLQPTSPLVCTEDVLSALRLHAESGRPVVSVAELEHPLSWMFRLDDALHLEPVVEGPIPTRRQDALRHVRLNGALYVARCDWLLEGHGFLGPESQAITMPQERSVDVDTPADLSAAEALVESIPRRPIPIGPLAVGAGEPCFIIAEIGVNHDGDLDTALELVEAAADAGADAVKIQTFTAERLVTRTAPKADYQLQTTDPGETQFEMLKRLELNLDEVREIQRHCVDQGVQFLSTPFDEESSDLLEELDVPAFKVGSGDLTNLPFLQHIAAKGRPMIVSTGMSSMWEVARAVEAITRVGLNDLVLLHCVSEYPADPASVNLNAMDTMRSAFGFAVGFSDHTEGLAPAMAAVAKGAVVIEKHLTLDRSRSGPDHRASVEPGDFANLVAGIRAVEVCLGSGDKAPVGNENAIAAVARKSVVALRDIREGEVFDPTNIGIRRPEGGLEPRHFGRILGRRASCDVAEGAWLQPEMFN